jgi:3,4-dihydroxy 2-butanone 4-phosphate synthase/GTP cyclohydrolase II
MKLDSIDTALAELKAGRPVIVVDDEDRENEGDIIMPAARATPEWVAFTIRHTSGILCVSLPLEEARRLNLKPMVSENDAPHGTAFTVSVDYREGLTTGISAEERCNTIRALANNNAGPHDFVRPGHIFPLVAREGGVLMRTGHTEAAVDLSRLAGLPPVGLLAELVNDDGTVKKGPQIEAFAAEHKLKLISIDNLIAYRQQREKLITRVSETDTQTGIGPAHAIVYETPFDAAHHVALVFGDIGDGRGVLARLHREDTIGDVFWAGHGAIAQSMELIRKRGRGVIVYLREGAVGVSRAGRRDDGGRMESHTSSRNRLEQWREIGLGAQILKDLGLVSIRVIGTKERQFKGLSGFGVEIEDTEIIEG